MVFNLQKYHVFYLLIYLFVYLHVMSVLFSMKFETLLPEFGTRLGCVIFFFKYCPTKTIVYILLIFLCTHAYMYAFLYTDKKLCRNIFTELQRNYSNTPIILVLYNFSVICNFLFNFFKYFFLLCRYAC